MRRAPFPLPTTTTCRLPLRFLTRRSLSAAGGRRDEPSDPFLAAGADDGPDVELYVPVFCQCQAGSCRTLSYKNPVDVK